MLKYFSQRDPRYNRELIGNTQLTMHNWGCLITTFVNAVIRIFGNQVGLDPKMALEMLKFNARGEVIHNSMKYNGMSARRIGYRPDHATITDFANNPKKAIGVEMAYNPEHWLLVTSWTVWWKPWFLAADPITYNPSTKTCRIVRKWKRNISGAFLFHNSN